jgi:hypothetical protein
MTATSRRPGASMELYDATPHVSDHTHIAKTAAQRTNPRASSANANPIANRRMCCQLIWVPAVPKSARIPCPSPFWCRLRRESADTHSEPEDEPPRSSRARREGRRRRDERKRHRICGPHRHARPANPRPRATQPAPQSAPGRVLLAVGSLDVIPLGPVRAGRLLWPFQNYLIG